ncbi:MAG: protein-disulfide reductase DsbD [Pseudomonadota bacterium]
MIPRYLLFLLSGLLTALPAAAIDGLGEDLLEPDKAFRITTELKDNSTIQVSWDIADGYYMYRDRIRFSTDTPGITLGEPKLPAGTIKNDEFFGKIAVFRDQVTATIPVSRTGEAPASVRLMAISQGCADIGVCYPPHTQTAMLDLSGTSGLKQAGIAALESLGDRLGLGPADDEFLEPDLAFQVDALTDAPDRVRIHWTIADKYYLYRDKITVQLANGAGATLLAPVLPAGKTKHDEFFGDVQVFYHETEAIVPLQRAASGPVEISLLIGYQGCAEAGICYPPIRKTLPVMLAAYSGDSTAAATAEAPVSASPTPAVTSRQDDVARVLRESSLGWVALFFFGAGVLLAFTACMYPMIPIISSIIVGHGEHITAGKAFSLTLIYVQAIAVTYAVIGLVSAQMGAGVQAFFQNPWILGFFALVFVMLALSMFGFYNMQLPASLQARLSDASNKQRGGSWLGVAVMGVLSALIVGPCAGPVLIGALLYTSQSGDFLTGAVAMFALGNGMGAPLLVICTSGGKLLPRAGGWMDTVKVVFGVILLGVAILMLERILPGPVTLALWALLLIIPAIYMRALDTLPDKASGWRRLWKGMGIAMLVYGVILLIGAATGARDPLNPLRNITAGVSVSGTGEHASQHLAFERIKSVEDFNAALQQSNAAGKPVMLDFYADWCTYCIKMEDYTFSDSRVQAALSDVTILQADVTANDATDLALLNHFNLFAPPAMLFFGPDGQERRNYRLVGFMGADDFLVHVKGAFGQ